MLLRSNGKRLLKSNGNLSRKEKAMEGQGSPYALKKDGGYLFGVFGVAYAEIMGGRFHTLEE